MTQLKNDRFLRALTKQPVDCTPIWIMRQAGRYLPEYRSTRAKAKDFLSLCKNPELACEVTLQPLRRFDLDAAILFSDILTIPDAMNIGLYFAEGEGPKCKNPVRDEKAVSALSLPNVDTDLDYVINAVKLIKQELNNSLPLIGFAGSPWTVATYMVEGGSSKTFNIIKKMLYAQPEVLHALLRKLTRATIDYLKAQINAGVDVVMVFDTWGGILTTPAYLNFSLDYMQEIVTELKLIKKNIPIILFTKQGNLWLEHIADSGCDALGVDWTIDLAEAKARVGNKVALQGNMDPSVLYAAPERIRAEAQRILASFNGNTGHVFNLGHGIYPDVNPDHVKILVDAVHGFRNN